jgi:hypothetical protein
LPFPLYSDSCGKIRLAPWMSLHDHRSLCRSNTGSLTCIFIPTYLRAPVLTSSCCCVINLFPSALPSCCQDSMLNCIECCLCLKFLPPLSTSP